MRSRLLGISPTEAVIRHPVEVTGVLGWMLGLPEGRLALERVAAMIGETETGSVARALLDNANSGRVRYSIPFDICYYAGGPAPSLRSFGSEPGDPSWGIDDGRRAR